MNSSSVQLKRSPGKLKLRFGKSVKMIFDPGKLTTHPGNGNEKCYINKYKHVLGHGKLLVITEFLAIAGLVISEVFDLSLKISFPPGLAADACYKRVLAVRELVINGLYCITLCHTFCVDISIVFGIVLKM